MNPKLEQITEVIGNYLNQFTAKNSIGRTQVVEAISLAVQRLYVAQDVFMANQGILTIDSNSYVNTTRLFAKANSFTSLDLTPMVSLEYLDLSSNPLSFGVDLSTLTNLKNLQIRYSQLTSLDISNNTQLEVLNVWDNLLDNLDISNNPLLIDLNIANCNLTETNMNTIFSILVANGLSNGTITIYGNASATGQGATDIATLQANGWTVNF